MLCGDDVLLMECLGCQPAPGSASLREPWIASVQPGLSLHSGLQRGPGNSRLTLCFSAFLLSNIKGKMK